MSFTYTYTADFAEARNAIRLIIGDTNAQNTDRDLMLSDQEIDYALHSKRGDVQRAALLLVESLAARAAREATSRTTRVGVEKAELYKHYSDLARRLRQQLIGPDAITRLQTKQQYLNNTSDKNIRQPKFRVGMLTNQQVKTDPQDLD